MASSSFSKSMNREDDFQEKPKKFKSTNSWLENKKLQNLLIEAKTLLEEERVEKLGQLSKAEWIPSIKLAKVIRKVGRQWMTMGHIYLGGTVLYPEEALFLLETNAIEINYGGLPMSLQQAYSVLLGENSTCTLEEYRAYSHLMKYGYRVLRHGLQEICSRKEREEPPEVDVLGVICKRKSSENISLEKTTNMENSVQVVKQDIPQKLTFTNGESCPSTSHRDSNQNLALAEDDDIKFIEVIDASKKRKVGGTIVIGDDVEITSENAGKESHSLGQSEASLNNNKVKSECKSKVLKQETAEELSDSLATSNCEDLVNEVSAESVNKPSRGMYKNEPFSTLRTDAEVCDSVPSSSVENKGTKNISRECKVQKNNPFAAEKSKCGNDDIIVLSDDETKSDIEQKEEIRRFYKEISLIELIDISEEDEDQKTTSSAPVKYREMDDSYDFWGVLGRIPTLKEGRLVITVPAPPTSLIPSNTSPVKDEYSINVSATVEKPSKESKEVVRRRDESCRQPDRGSSNHISQSQRNRFQEVSPYYRAEQQQVQNPWNPWDRNNGFGHAQNSSSAFPSTSSSINVNHTNYPRSSWLSFVYPPRLTNYSVTQYQSWCLPGHAGFPQTAEYSNYPPQQFSNCNIYRDAYRQQPRHFPYNRGRGASWQRATAPRTGNGYHHRGGGSPFSRKKVWNKPVRNLFVEDENKYTSVVPKNPDAHNWSEIKLNGKKEKKVESSNGSQADTKDILPLVKPTDCISIDAVHSKLRLTSSAKFNHDISDESTCPLSIKFDLYMPNYNFRKSCPGTPRYRLSVVKSNDSIPKLADVSYLTKSLNDEVPLLFAVGFPENINFFSFSNVDLPVQLAK